MMINFACAVTYKWSFYLFYLFYLDMQAHPLCRTVHAMW